MKPKPKPKKPKHGNAGNKHAQKGASPRVPLFVRVPPATVETLKHQAAARGLSQADTIVIAVDKL
jgi:hypothetical protein